MSKLTPAMVERMGRGRAKGSVNKTTKLAKQAIAEAFEQLGGTDALVKWALDNNENRKVFYATIWPKIIPVQAELTGKDGGAIQFEQRVREDADVVSSAVLGLASRIRASGMAGETEH